MKLHRKQRDNEHLRTIRADIRLMSLVKCPGVSKPTLSEEIAVLDQVAQEARKKQEQ